MVDIIESANGRIVSYGDSIRIERRFQAEEDGSFVWVVYRLTPVVKGIHPVTGHHTSETAVWTIAGHGTEEEARAQAAALAG